MGKSKKRSTKPAAAEPIAVEPSRLLLKLADRLFGDTIERSAFVQSLGQAQRFAPCLLWLTDRPDPFPFAALPPLAMQPAWVDRLDLTADQPANRRPGKHPLHEAGAFYCLDFSSVFAASALLAIPDRVDRLVDLCAAPGGKSVFAWRALQPSLLVANEAIGKRIGMLVSNLKRCGLGPAIATCADPETLAQAIPGWADLVIVDAPCSGQSLLAKGEKNPGCFHPLTIGKNANRQKRILANAAALVAPGGWLAYMTCTYAIEENEGATQWLLDRFPHLEPQPVPALEPWRSTHAAFPGYRMFPQAGLGAGSFVVLLRDGRNGPVNPESANPEPANSEPANSGRSSLFGNHGALQSLIRWQSDRSKPF
ncbi:MAG: RsmB/NOP family class I SAM-dependent RNA methyltransferase [Limnothrix sp. CACIAM 69d]|nr:MAG: RsmB/NOP family class I SAM-dependent RNA methyltransferase [Limnothrix sp. CACIAM 69d]